MIVDTMSPDDKFRELNIDSIWINNMRGGWMRKYSKELKKKRKNTVTHTDTKKYVTPNHNTVYVLFYIQKSDYNNRYNCLLWQVLFEFIHKNNSSSFILYRDSEALTISSHAIQRMHERSGKSLFDLLKHDTSSSKNGIFCWIQYDHNENPNERICAWGDGILLGKKLSYREYVATTYLDRCDIHSNQMLLSYESLVSSQKVYDRRRKVESLHNPKLMFGYVKCSA